MLVDGYVRVSQVRKRQGERFMSPELQRDQIEKWAALNGHSVDEVFVELDESGARADRPLLLRAIERVERGDSQGIVVARLDRFGRSLTDGLAHIERIDSAGGVFVSVHDGLDLSTATGRLVLRIMLSMAEWELERVRMNWAHARRRAMDRGVYVSGTLPTGYRRRDDGVLEPDPVAGPVITQLFRRRAQGATTAELKLWIEGTGIRTSRGNPYFGRQTLRGLLKNRVYLGELGEGEHRRANAHEPLVDPATWEAAQTTEVGRNMAPTHPLTGLLRCASCSHIMGRENDARLRKGVGVRRFRCLTKGEREACPGRARISIGDVQPLIEDLVFRLRAGVRRKRDNAVSSSQAAVDLEARALVEYRDNIRLQMTLGSEDFEAGVLVRRRRLERARMELAAARRAEDEDDLPDGRELERCWPTLDEADRRKAIQSVIDCVFVSPGVGPATERVYVCRRGEEPVDLPRAGQAMVIKPFKPDGRMRRSGYLLREPKRWSEERIERELRELIGEGNDWPSYEQFARAGRARLHAQVLTWGGPYFWVARLGLNLRGHILPRWNEEMLRNALGAFLAGRDSWPPAREFQRAGLHRLWKVASNFGGIDRWAQEFGLERRYLRRSRRQA
jgi:DNA invertase Pin-like site-specific DNA recombinase